MSEGIGESALYKFCDWYLWVLLHTWFITP